MSATDCSLCGMKKRLSIFALSCAVVASCGGDGDRGSALRFSALNTS